MRTTGRFDLSTARLLQAFSPDGSAAHVGIERLAAEIDGRKGTFVLRHAAVGSRAQRPLRAAHAAQAGRAAAAAVERNEPARCETAGT